MSGAAQARAPTTANCVAVQSCGGPAQLTYSTYQEAPLPNGNVRVSASAFGVHQVDLALRSGKIQMSLPVIPGFSSVGEVTEISSGVGTVSVGDRVVAICGKGGYSERFQVSAGRCFRIPADISDVKVGAYFARALWARYLVDSVAQVTRDKIVVIWGAAGGVGELLTMLCSLSGAQVAGIAGGIAKAERCLEKGAHFAIDHTTSDVVSEVMRITDGAGADVVFDCVGAPTFDLSLAMLASNALMVSTGCIAADIPPIPTDKLGNAASAKFTQPLLQTLFTQPKVLKKTVDTVFSDLRTLGTTPQVRPLSDIAAIHSEMESRRSMGSCVVDLRLA